MTAIVNNDMRVFSANQFLNAFDNKKYDAWVTGTAYSIGDQVFSGNYKYIATSAGTSGVSAPAHVTGVVSDGGVDWLFVEAFTNLDNFQNNVYIGIGRVDAWDNPGLGGEDPIDPVDDMASQRDQLSRILSVKRIQASDVKMAILRNEWDATGSTVYSEFDPSVESFNYANPHYVEANGNIYICLNNNNGAVSTTQPTGQSVDQFVTPGDGYTWKFMGEIDAADALKFLTPTYAPVELKLSDDGSAQWAVQQNAKKSSISTIKVTDGGSGYTSATVTIDAPASGTTATATAVLNAGVVESIQLTVIGEGYLTTPNVTITGDGAGATAEAVLAPKDGHGSNILKELNARYVAVNARFDDDEGGYFPISGESDFRQIMIIVDPKDVNGNVAEATRYIGPDNDNWDGSETSGLSELESGSGTILYTESIPPVVRTTGQVEDIKLILKF